jgi:DNA polymerase-3 subunit epsilon
MTREIALDTETTGLDPAKGGHRIVEIGCVEMINRVRTGNVFHSYLDPERDVPNEAYKIHGLSGPFLRGKPKFTEVATEFLAFIDDAPLVIHNAGFDLKFVNFELAICGFAAVDGGRTIVDTLNIARQKFPGAPASLDALCKRFNIDLSTRTKHGALLDAELLADMYLELMGGSQSSLEFASKKNSGQQLKEATSYKEPRPHAATQEEEAAHEEFIKKIKNPLWLASASS